MSKLVNLTMFRGYVNKVLPTVYDDSLSYYEVLAKVMEKINEIINLDNAQNEIINNIPEDVSEFAEDLAQFKSSMTQQFNDFKTEINADMDSFEAEVNAKIAADSTPTQGSTKLVTSGGVYASLQDIINSLVKDAHPTKDSTNYVTSGGVWKAINDAVEDLEATLYTKQNALTWDTTPTANSTNPVQSGGIKSYVDNAKQAALDSLDNYITTNDSRVSGIEGDITDLETGKQDALTFDLTPTLGSNNPVTSDGIAQAIAGVTPSIDVDPEPTQGSTNAVSSNGVYVVVSNLETELEEGLSDKQDTLTFDVLPTQNSLNPVTSGGVWSAIAQVDPSGTIDPTPTQGSTAAVSSGGTWTAINNVENELTNAIATKQDALTFDNTPTINSGNPVTSDGIYRALQEKQSALTFDSTPTQYSTNPVTSGGVYDAIQQGGGGGGTIDPVPTEGSTNAVQSGGTWAALQGKQNTLTFDSVPTQYSTNPVTSGGVYDAIQQGGGGGGTIDPVPTEGSTNAVQSGGTWTALQGKADKSETAEYAIIGTTTGANPTITNSTNGNVQNLTIYGASRTSKNLVELENGTFDTNGSKLANSYRVRSTKIIDLPAGTYTISASSNNGTVNVSYTTWQNSKTDGTNSIITDADWYTSTTTFTFNSSVHLSCVCKYTNDSAIDASEITYQLERGSTPTPYEPYFAGIKNIGDNGELEITTENSDSSISTTAALTTGLPLCGIPVNSEETYTDENNVKWLADTSDNKSVVKRCGIVDLGSLTWTYTTGILPRFSTIYPDIDYKSSARTTPLVCAEYEVISDGRSGSDLPDRCIYCGASDNKELWIIDTRYTDATTFKNALTGVKLIYPLAIQTTQELTATEKTELHTLRTFDGTTSITVTDTPTINVEYLLNSLNGQAVANVWAAIPSGGGITKTLLYDNAYDGVQDTLITTAGNLLTGGTYDEYEVEYILFDGSSTNDNLCYPTIMKFRPETITNLNTDYSGIFNVGIVTQCIYDAFAYFNVYEDTDLQDNPVTKFELDTGRSNIPADMVININRIWGIS